MEKQTAGRDALNDFAPKFAELNDDILFGEVWAREDLLSSKLRSIVTVSALIGKGIVDNSLMYHLETAKKHGVTKTEMSELLTHIAFYAGWPNAWAAFRMAKEVYQDEYSEELGASSGQNKSCTEYGTSSGQNKSNTELGASSGQNKSCTEYGTSSGQNKSNTELGASSGQNKSCTEYGELPSQGDRKEEHGGFFGQGEPNNAYAQYFIGQSYLKPLTDPKETVFIANVTFEPGCRNNWHIHHAVSGGGQILICVEGEGWYQEEGKPAQSLVPGDIVTIPAGVKHWHGAKKNSWFSHLAVECPGQECHNEWCEPVDDEQYQNLQK